MRIAHDVALTASARVGLSVAATLAVLLVVAVAVRPEMMSVGMGMIRGLVVGFGL